MSHLPAWYDFCMNANRPEDFDVVVLGAGAAGLMCAMTTGALTVGCFLLDHADEVGKKILISGSGRCNFTNLHATSDNRFQATRIFANRRWRATPSTILLPNH